MANNSPISTSSLECTSHLQTYIPLYHLLSLGGGAQAPQTETAIPPLPRYALLVSLKVTAIGSPKQETSG